MQPHRLHGRPASQIFELNGRKSCESYWENNKLHRLNGKPARIIWSPGGGVIRFFFEYGLSIFEYRSNTKKK